MIKGNDAPSSIHINRLYLWVICIYHCVGQGRIVNTAFLYNICAIRWTVWSMSVVIIYEREALFPGLFPVYERREWCSAKVSSMRSRVITENTACKQKKKQSYLQSCMLSPRKAVKGFTKSSNYPIIRLHCASTCKLNVRKKISKELWVTWIGNKVEISDRERDQSFSFFCAG